jgi:hypothetical protein
MKQTDGVRIRLLIRFFLFIPIPTLVPAVSTESGKAQLPGFENTVCPVIPKPENCDTPKETRYRASQGARSLRNKVP